MLVLIVTSVADENADMAGDENSFDVLMFSVMRLINFGCEESVKMFGLWWMCAGSDSNADAGDNPSLLNKQFDKYTRYKEKLEQFEGYLLEMTAMAPHYKQSKGVCCDKARPLSDFQRFDDNNLSSCVHTSHMVWWPMSTQLSPVTTSVPQYYLPRLSYHYYNIINVSLYVNHSSAQWHIIWLNNNILFKQRISVTIKNLQSSWSHYILITLYVRMTEPDHKYLFQDEL